MTVDWHQVVGEANSRALDKHQRARRARAGFKPDVLVKDGTRAASLIEELQKYRYEPKTGNVPPHVARRQMAMYARPDHMVDVMRYFMEGMGKPKKKLSRWERIKKGLKAFFISLLPSNYGRYANQRGTRDRKPVIDW